MDVFSNLLLVCVCRKIIWPWKNQLYHYYAQPSCQRTEAEHHCQYNYRWVFPWVIVTVDVLIPWGKNLASSAIHNNASKTHLNDACSVNIVCFHYVLPFSYGFVDLHSHQNTNTKCTRSCNRATHCTCNIKVYWSFLPTFMHTFCRWRGDRRKCEGLAHSLWLCPHSYWAHIWPLWISSRCEKELSSSQGYPWFHHR